MGTVYRKTYTKPLPAGAEFLAAHEDDPTERATQRIVRWKDGNGRKRTAKVTRGRDGTKRVLVEAATFTAKYRDGNGHVREVATGCRTESGARSVLNDLETRAEKVRAKLLTAAEDKIADHQATPLTEHFDAYERHLQSERHRPRCDTRRRN